MNGFHALTAVMPALKLFPSEGVESDFTAWAADEKSSFRSPPSKWITEWSPAG